MPSWHFPRCKNGGETQFWPDFYTIFSIQNFIKITSKDSKEPLLHITSWYNRRTLYNFMRYWGNQWKNHGNCRWISNQKSNVNLNQTLYLIHFKTDLSRSLYSIFFLEIHLLKTHYKKSLVLFNRRGF